MKRKWTVIALLLAFFVSNTGCQEIIAAYFFVSTVTTSTPQEQTVVVSSNATTIKDEGLKDNTYTLLLYKRGQTYMYQGNTMEQDLRRSKTLGIVSIGDVLKAATATYGNSVKLRLKSEKHAAFKSMTTLLDEIAKNNIKKYTIEEMNKREASFESVAQ